VQCSSYNILNYAIIIVSLQDFEQRLAMQPIEYIEI